jgi:hypothetical protein
MTKRLCEMTRCKKAATSKVDDKWVCQKHADKINAFWGEKARYSIKQSNVLREVVSVWGMPWVKHELAMIAREDRVARKKAA